MNSNEIGNEFLLFRVAHDKHSENPHKKPLILGTSIKAEMFNKVLFKQETSPA